MKFLNLILILLFSTSFVNAQFCETVLRPKLEDYKPYVGFKQCEKYELKAGKDSENKNLVNIWQYNKKGQQQVEVWLLESTDTIVRITLEYNKNNQLIRSLEYAPVYSFKEIPTAYFYNDKGLLEKLLTLSPDSTIVIISYDAKGFIRECNAFEKVSADDENGNESAKMDLHIYKNVFKTDQIGRITEFNHISLSSNDEFNYSAFYTYNKNGQISSYKSIAKDGNVKFEETYSFDKLGKVKASKINEKGPNGIFKTTYYRYEYK
jgi:hypothetical protein